MHDPLGFMGIGNRPRNVKPPECLKSFIGAAIQVEEQTRTFRRGKPNEYQCTETKPIDFEPTLTAMYKAAAENNINLRIHTPGSMATMDHQFGRLNAHVEQNDNGDWVVSDKFQYG